MSWPAGLKIQREGFTGLALPVLGLGPGTFTQPLQPEDLAPLWRLTGLPCSLRLVECGLQPKLNVLKSGSVRFAASFKECLCQLQSAEERASGMPLQTQICSIVAHSDLTNPGQASRACGEPLPQESFVCILSALCSNKLSRIVNSASGASGRSAP